jgi:hypothetical protein
METPSSFEAVRVPDIAPVTEAVVFDEKDAALLGAAITWRAVFWKPIVGDYCILAGGDVRRLASSYSNRFQVGHEAGSFHLHDIGTMSYSGSLGRSVMKVHLVDHFTHRSANCWMWHHGRSGAHRGVGVIVPCRVWREVVS